MELEQICEEMYNPNVRKDTLNATALALHATKVTYELHAEQNEFYSSGLDKITAIEEEFYQLWSRYEKEFLEHPFANHPNPLNRKDIDG